jgi:RNA polymerase-associated protein RTF1
LQSELNRYKVTCHNEDVPLPTKESLQAKIDDINGLIEHKWTGEEIKARMALRSELRRKFDPAERERVSRLLEEARERGDDNKVEELQEELDKLGAQRLAFKTSLGPSKHTDSPKAGTEQDRLAERNRENRRLNVEGVRKAQLKERARAMEIEAAITRGEPIKDDPSRRLRTKAKFFIQNGEEAKKTPNGSGTGTPTNGAAGTGSQKQTVLPHLLKLQEEKHAEVKGMPTIHKPLMDDDVIGALDLDIDVDI